MPPVVIDDAEIIEGPGVDPGARVLPHTESSSTRSVGVPEVPPSDASEVALVPEHGADT
jgi:hypothetical protein